MIGNKEEEREGEKDINRLSQHFSFYYFHAAILLQILTERAAKNNFQLSSNSQHVARVSAK
jgi:hypothetical protein